MTPPMHTRVRNHFVDAGLTEGFITQLLMWNDGGSLTDAFMVFRPSGGTAVDGVISSEYYVSVDVVGAKGGNSKADLAVQNIIEYVKSNPMTNPCLGQITNMGGIPTPIPTTEGRIVFRLLFSCLYGE
ncbi:hypothetical protein ACLEDI_00855 [Lonsdalea quercina]|uniref:phage tail termination protein n=1 Tax=Lonsdalea quercina TaxID=71657 RepID=UPI0039748FC1